VTRLRDRACRQQYCQQAECNLQFDSTHRGNLLCIDTLLAKKED
jgi:hypothetical protein